MALTAHVMSTHTAANPAPAVKRKSALKIISATVTLFLTLAVKGVSSFSIVPKIDLTRKNNTAPAKIDKLMTPKYALYVMLMGWSSNAACTAGMSEWMFLGTEPRLTENIDALPISSVVETYPAASDKAGNSCDQTNDKHDARYLLAYAAALLDLCDLYIFFIHNPILLELLIYHLRRWLYYTPRVNLCQQLFNDKR